MAAPRWAPHTPEVCATTDTQDRPPAANPGARLAGAGRAGRTQRR